MCSPSNICGKCLQEQGVDRPDNLLFETGDCSHCKKFGEVVDLDLLALYAGLGFDAEFIHAHLPRLRMYGNKLLSLEDIGKEIARHAIFGPCRELLPCSGYGDRPWQFGNIQSGIK